MLLWILLLCIRKSRKMVYSYNKGNHTGKRLCITVEEVVEEYCRDISIVEVIPTALVVSTHSNKDTHMFGTDGIPPLMVFLYDTAHPRKVPVVSLHSTEHPLQ